MIYPHPVREESRLPHLPSQYRRFYVYYEVKDAEGETHKGQGVIEAVDGKTAKAQAMELLLTLCPTCQLYYDHEVTMDVTYYG